MELMKPLCRRSKFNKKLAWFQIDYTNMFPVGSTRGLTFPLPCRGHPIGNITDTLMAGSEFISKIAGEITHNGGHCEWSISYDGVHFVVIKTIIGTCLTLGARQYSIPLPSTAPSGPAVLAWTWINRTGLREYYTNCADVVIISNYTANEPSGHIIGPSPVIANLPGYPTIPQFTNTVLGEDLYKGRPDLSIPVKRYVRLRTNHTRTIKY